MSPKIPKTKKTLFFKKRALGTEKSIFEAKFFYRMLGNITCACLASVEPVYAHTGKNSANNGIFTPIKAQKWQSPRLVFGSKKAPGLRKINFWGHSLMANGRKYNFCHPQQVCQSKHTRSRNRPNRKKSSCFQ